MDQFQFPLGFYFGHSRLAVAESCKGFAAYSGREHAFSLLAGDWVGCPGAPCLFYDCGRCFWGCEPITIGRFRIRYHVLQTILIYMVAGLVFPDLRGSICPI